MPKMLSARKKISFFFFFGQCCYSFHKESQHSNVSSVMGLLNSPSCERDTRCMKWNTVSYSLQHSDFPPVLQSQTWEEACKEQKLMKRSTLQVIYKHLSCFFSLPTALPCTLCFDPSILIFAVILSFAVIRIWISRLQNLLHQKLQNKALEEKRSEAIPLLGWGTALSCVFSFFCFFAFMEAAGKKGLKLEGGGRSELNREEHRLSFKLCPDLPGYVLWYSLVNWLKKWDMLKIGLPLEKKLKCSSCSFKQRSAVVIWLLDTNSVAEKCFTSRSYSLQDRRHRPASINRNILSPSSAFQTGRLSKRLLKDAH